MRFFKRLKDDQSGATAIEYGLIAALVAVAAITAIGSLTKEDDSVETTTQAMEKSH